MESGSGKTETAKLVLEYLAKAVDTINKSYSSKLLRSSQVGTDMMKTILCANTVLEAVGNAQIVQNNNGSRFGKLIELYFSENGEMFGAQITTYLLELLRIPTQRG